MSEKNQPQDTEKCVKYELFVRFNLCKPKIFFQIFDKLKNKYSSSNLTRKIDKISRFLEYRLTVICFLNIGFSILTSKTLTLNFFY